VSAVIIIGLVVMWAVVLIPMWLRRHDETEETRSVDRFTTAMHTLSRREAREAREAKQAVAAERYGLMPHRARNVEVHVSGASAPRQRLNAPLTAAQRRRRTLTGLLLATVVFLIAAAATSSVLVWVLQVMCDLALGAFVVHLRRMAISSAAARRRRPAPRREVADSYVEPAPVDAHYEERVAVRRYASEQIREATYGAPIADDPDYYEAAAYDAASSSSDAVFDQTVIDEYAARAAVGDVFDQDAVFDQAEPEPAPVENQPSFIEAGVQPAWRGAAVRDEPEQAAAPAAPSSTPWEPVPVPRPTYTMKPAAPPRRRRAEIDEPLLPPVETAAEMQSADELEEILDRRWAVND
jgi:hypothetical protein